MNNRCRNSRHNSFKNYGARGITVCEEWQHRFAVFWAEMGSTWFEGAQLDREENNLGYGWANCRWVTRKVNNRNRRDSVKINTRWGLLTVSEAAEKASIKVATVFARIKYGWPETDLLIPLKFIKNI